MDGFRTSDYELKVKIFWPRTGIHGSIGEYEIPFKQKSNQLMDIGTQVNQSYK